MELIRQGLKCNLALVAWKPGFESELILRVEDGQDAAHIGLMFLWSSLAFLEASPLSHEGIHSRDYRPDDGWGSLDFLRCLKWHGGRLGLDLGVIRGRQVATELVLIQDTLFVVRTRGRGDSPLHWYETFSS